MSEPTSNIRHLVKRALVESLRVALPDTQVEVCFPGKTLKADSIYFGPCEGLTKVPTSKSGRSHQQDDFTLSCVVQAGREGGEPEDCEDRAAQLLKALYDTFSDDTTLGNLPGVQTVGFEAQLHGPNTYRTPKGPVTFYALEISCSTRYQ